MRPLRLEVEGFTSFRDKVVVDFDGLDLFAITGPTGAGKSSLLDAMVLALYGQVPRVAKEYKQLISHGAERMSVRLDFRIGEADYRIARTVRTSGQPQFRLERIENGLAVGLADRASEVAAEVERLLGLDYDAFVRSVVLPQGQFDAFLKGKPEERRKILVALLNLDVYRRMLELANAKAAGARRQAEFLGRELETTLAGAGAEAVAARRQELREAEARREESERAVGALTAARKVAQRVRDARRDLERLDREAEAEEARRRGLESALAAAGERARTLAAEAGRAARALAAVADDPGRHLALTEARPRIEQLVAAAARADALARDVEANATACAGAEAASATAAAEVASAETSEAQAVNALAEAEAARDEAQRRHAAHALRRQLRKDEPCPVCEQVVKRLPKGSAPALDGAEAAVSKARAAGAAARRALDQARVAAERAAAEARQVGGEAVRLRRESVAARTAVEALRKPLAALFEAARLDAPDTLLRDVADALRALEAARADRERLERDLRRIEKEAAGHESERARAEGGAKDAAARLAAIGRSRTEAERELREALEAFGEPEAMVAELDTRLTAAQKTAQEAAARAARLRAEAERLAQDAARADELRGRKGALDREAGLLGALASHLKADQFLAWVQEEALGVLAEDATRHLMALSRGRYSLLWKDQDFVVEDHWNAGGRRSVKTLSGGETFLASLSLALGLAERVAALASEGRAGEALESLFLDEGFGSLDADALDQVIDALDELHGGQRMVGVVTHLQALAERLPARVEVRRGDSGSRIAVA
ncbi:MAG TPA: SMC family ATPase [Vicinamibacteria bacterium]|nr:SMC family ATPase [Vicinamibacteria bacterium]